MRIAVLAAPESWYLNDLRRAAGSDFQIQAASFKGLAAALGGRGREPERCLGDELDFSRSEAVLVRSMPPGSLEQVVFRMDVLARLEASGTPVINPPRSLEVAIDKYLALARLQAAGLCVPRTVVVQTSDQAMAAFDDLGQDVVLKPLFGGEGRGIARLTDEALALRAFRMLEQLGAVLYLQEFVPHGGYDIRLLVLGSQVLAIARRNPLDWRTNLSRGAVAEAVELQPGWRELALAAAAAVGAPVAGVDLLPALDGRQLLLEVNAVPGWKGIARATGIDVARKLLEFLRQKSS